MRAGVAWGARAGLLLGLCTALSAYAPGVAPAGASSASGDARLDSMVRFLQDAQNPDGGFGGVDGAPSDPDVSAWVTFALAAAGVNPQDQARPGGVDAYTYLGEHASELTLTTDFERALLVADASGTPPEAFGGVNLVGAILARELPDGSFVHEAGGRQAGVNDTIYAILALSPIHEPAAEDAVRRAAGWVQDAQLPDGSWPAVKATGEVGEVDMTGAAIEALNAAGRHDTGSQSRAFAYLHAAQEPDGGFPEFPGEGESNVASTAWAAQGMWSARDSPETWSTGSGLQTEQPLAYMASMQQPDGHIRWRRSRDSYGVWMTAMVAPAFAGDALPIPTVPRSLPSKPSAPSAGAPIPAPASGPEAGQGGEAVQPGSGVIAGGGGEGAPLFSRPKPQSKGHTRGSVRLLSSTATTRKRHRAQARSARRPVARVTRAAHSAPARATRTAATARSQAALRVGSGGGGQAQGRDVEGVLLGAPAGAHALESAGAGAPGLHGAQAGGGRRSSLASAIGAAIALLLLAGWPLERRRPQVIL